MIKLRCCNSECAFSYSVSEAELKEYGELYHNKCMICGSKLIINNLGEIMEKDIMQKVKENLDKYIGELGIEGAWELIERNKNQACARLYFEEFKRRGINLNGF